MSSHQPKILCIVGPTSSGKTSLGIALAKHFNGEVVNADARQVYQGFDIGTGKPEGVWDKDVLLVESIPHHLMRWLRPEEMCAMIAWRVRALEVIREIAARGHVPIVVGGTGLYIRALVDNFDAPAVVSSGHFRAKMGERSLDELVAELKRVDPESAKVVDLKNPRRVLRALEVVHVTGRSFVEQQKKGEPLVDAFLMGIAHSSEEFANALMKMWTCYFLADGSMK